MKKFTPVYLILGLIFCVAGAANAQTKTLKVAPVKATTAQSGADLFREFCAACHGFDGKGSGPAAVALKSKPTDLTQVSRHNGNKFPTIEMRIAVAEGKVAAHGSSEMPVWGDVLKSISPNSGVTTLRINNLVSYIQTLQQ